MSKHLTPENDDTGAETEGHLMVADEQPGAKADEQPNAFANDDDEQDTEGHRVAADQQAGYARMDDQPSAEARQQHDEDDTEGHKRL